MNGNPFYVKPGNNFGKGLTGLASTVGQIGQQKKKEAAEEQKKKEYAEAVDMAMKAYNSGDPDMIAAVNIKYPKISQDMKLTQNAQHRNERLKGEYDTNRRAFIANPSEDNFYKAVNSWEKSRLYSGADPDKIAEQKQKQIEQFNKDPELYQKKILAEEAATDTEWYLDYKKAMGEGEDSDNRSALMKEYRLAKDEGYAGDFVAYQKEFKNLGKSTGGFQKGSTFVVRNADDSVSLVTPKFNPNTGELEASTAPLPEGSELISELGETIGERQAREINTAGGKEATTQAAKASSEYAEQAKVITEGLVDLNDAIVALDEGAETGFIDQYLPSFRKSTVAFENAASRMGLSIIASGKFGPLSEGEMKLSMTTAVPRSMSPEATNQWLIDKRGAQTKLRNHLNDLAYRLDMEGMTRGKLARQLRREDKLGVSTEDMIATMEANRGMSYDEIIDAIERRQGAK
jgi:hypothetical protein